MKKTFEEISIIRGLACLAVIFVHLSASPIVALSPANPFMMVLTLLNRSVKFTTPVFLFISGFLLYMTFETKPFHYPAFLKKRLSALLNPYVLWSLLYAAVFIVMGVFAADPLAILKKLVLADMNYHLYFVATILQFYLLFGLFRFAFKTYQKPWLILSLFAVNLLTVSFLNFPYADRFFGKYLFFFGLGCYMAVHKDWIFDHIKTFRSVYISLYLSSASVYTMIFYAPLDGLTTFPSYLEPLAWLVFSATAIPVLYLVADRIIARFKGLRKGLNNISEASYVIYLSHPLALYASEYFMNKIGVQGVLDRFTISSLLTFGMTLTFAMLYLIYKDARREGELSLNPQQKLRQSKSTDHVTGHTLNSTL